MAAGDLVCALPPFLSAVVPSDQTTSRDVDLLKNELQDYLAEMLRLLCSDFRLIPAYSSPVTVASAVVDLPLIAVGGSGFIDVTTSTPVPLGTHIISWAPLTDATSIDDLMIQILVVAANTVRVNVQNPTGAPVDPDPITFQFITATATDT